MLAIEKIVKRENKWKHIKEFKLDRLVKLLNVPYTNVAIAAGTALMEMPPDKRHFFHACYNAFLQVHAPTPNLVIDYEKPRES